MLEHQSCAAHYYPHLYHCSLLCQSACARVKITYQKQEAASFQVVFGPPRIRVKQKRRKQSALVGSLASR